MTKPRLRADLTPLRSSRDFRLLYISRTVTALGTQARSVSTAYQLGDDFSLIKGAHQLGFGRRK